LNLHHCSESFSDVSSDSLPSNYKTIKYKTVTRIIIR
jgi:hypothetical protein